jgi:riboflavin kinase/FMN adenylyltransferase
MKVLRGPAAEWHTDAPTGTAVGVFDGVHLGHRHVLGALLERTTAIEATPAVLTFDPHPLVVLAPHLAPPRLTTIEQRAEQLAALGVELLAVLPFTPQVRDMTPAAFVTDILVDRLSSQIVAAGADFRFGANRAGDVDLLHRMGNASGFEVIASELVGPGEPVSSTQIRSALAIGEISVARALLGRDYELAATASHARFREGVVATVFEVDETLAVPGAGDYIGWCGEVPVAIRITDQAVVAVSSDALSASSLRFVDSMALAEGASDADALARLDAMTN